MNLAQLRVAVRDKLSAGGGTSDALDADDFWKDSEVNYYLNEAQNKLYHAILRAKSDYFTRIITSSDANLTILGRTYDPSSLAMVQDQGEYTLPPDFVRGVGFYDARADETVWFRWSDIKRSEFKRLYQQGNIPGVNYGTLLLDVINARTLVVRPKPNENFDTTLLYVRRLGPLNDYTTGTVAVTNGSTTATFTSADVANNFQVGDELLVGTASTAPSPDPNTVYPVIAAISDPTVTLDGPYTGVNGSGLNYIRSRVSEIPHQHHYALVLGAIVEGFQKGTNPNPTSVAMYKTDYQAAVQDVIAEVETRQSVDFETAEAYMEDFTGDWS